MEEKKRELTAEEVAHIIDVTGRADTYNGPENFSRSRQLCQMAGLLGDFDEADEEGADYENIVAEAAKKLNVYSIIYGEEADA